MFVGVAIGLDHGLTMPSWAINDFMYNSKVTIEDSLQMMSIFFFMLLVMGFIFYCSVIIIWIILNQRKINFFSSQNSTQGRKNHSFHEVYPLNDLVMRISNLFDVHNHI